MNLLLSYIKNFNLVKIRTLVGILSLVFGLFSGALFFASLAHTESWYLFTHVLVNEIPGAYGDYVGGFVGTVLTVESLLLVAYTILGQTCANSKNAVVGQFFKMLDYHQNNLEHISIKPFKKENPPKESAVHRMAFVTLKIQYHYLLQEISKINDEKKLKLNHEEIADISIVIFYYGLTADWKHFIVDKLSMYGTTGLILIDSLLEAMKGYEKGDIGRTNQTYLSSYFRNMYNAIKLIDESVYLTDDEKHKYVKILRAQLSNPELYILFFNLLSRFGKKWREKQYVEKYSLLTNLPMKYCDNYDPHQYFPIDYEEDEI